MYEVLEVLVNSRLAAIKAELRKKGVRQLEFLSLTSVIDGGQPLIKELLYSYYDSEEDHPSENMIDAMVPREIVDFTESIGLTDPGLRELVVNFFSFLKSHHRKHSQKIRSLLREQILREQVLAYCDKNNLAEQFRNEAELERVTREINLMRDGGINLYLRECMSIVILMIFKLKGLGIQFEDILQYASQHVPLDQLIADSVRRSEAQGRLLVINGELQRVQMDKGEFTEVCKRYSNDLELEEWERLLKTFRLEEGYYQSVISMLKSLK